MHALLGRVAPLLLASAAVLTGCSRAPAPPAAAKPAPGLSLPEPVVRFTENDPNALPGQKIDYGQWIAEADETRRALHAQHHSHKVLVTARLPGRFEPPPMKSVTDFAISKDELFVIRPGPGEYVHVMEGQRHGNKNLTVGITYTAPGGSPPMHTHMGEEAHVLLKGNILYALGDEIFRMDGPYIVNIPPMVPHSFQNLGEDVAELVVIFPTNVWEYDVLDYFPFKDPRARSIVEAAEKEKGHR